MVETRNVFGQTTMFDEDDLRHGVSFDFIYETSDCLSCNNFIPREESKRILDCANKGRRTLMIVDFDNPANLGLCDAKCDVRVIEKRVSASKNRPCKIKQG